MSGTKLNNIRVCAGRGALLAFGLLAAGTAIGELEIRGVGGDVEKVLSAFVTVDELACDAPRWWVERRHRQAPEEIRRGMEVLGFYQAEVESSLDFGEKCWKARYDVIPGEPVQIEAFDLEIQGSLAGEPRLRDALDRLELAPGEPFSHRGYEAVKDRLLEVAQSLGYFDAEFTRRRVEVNPATNLADIRLTLAGGDRYRIGDIELTQRVLDDELFQRFLRFEKGQFYDAPMLAVTYRNLIESDYFDQVLVAPDLDSRSDGLVPVQITATASTRRSALVGAGFATDTGPRGRLDLRYRRVNDAGHRANLSALVSAVSGELRADYRLPYGDPTHEWYFVGSDVSFEKTDTSESLRRGVNVGRTLRRGRAWAETNYLEYTVEDFDVGEQDGTSQMMLLGTSWARTTTVDASRPLRGYSLSLDVRGAAKAMLSDQDLVQMIIRGRQIVPLGERFRLLGRAQAGWTWQQEFEDLPPSLRFFAGGDNSVRGYGFEQLGPEQDGEVVGGKRLLTASLELDALIRPNWSVALFVDTGAAYNNTPDFSTGVGLGLRWYSPLGPLRIDLAHPLDDPDRSVRLHISLGPDL